MVDVAVLMTSYNRKKKTLKCLYRLFDQKGINIEFTLNIFLVIDGSTDGTADEVLNLYPSVNVIYGDGTLYWSGGTRRAWLNALNYKHDFMFYLWVNDDAFLFDDAVLEMLNCYKDAKEKYGNDCLIVGSCCQDESLDTCTYGGKIKGVNLTPNNTLQECRSINGNCVLVSRNVMENVGVISEEFTHSLGDYDYGFRAQEKGYKCLVSRKYVGVCEINQARLWADKRLPLKERIRLHGDVKGRNIKEYTIFIKKHYRKFWYIYYVVEKLRLFFPSFYDLIVKIIRVKK